MGAPIYCYRYVFSIDELSGGPFTYGHTTNNLHTKIDILSIRLCLAEEELRLMQDKLAIFLYKNLEAVAEILDLRA